MSNPKRLSLIEWYEGDNNYSEARKDEMKAQAKLWLNMLNKAYTDGNRVSARVLWATLKAENPEKGNHPSRNFVEDFLRRQGYHQKYKRVPKGSDPIQAVITTRPNQLIQVDYVYFYWAKDGFEDARGEGPLDESADDFKEKEKEVSKAFKKVADDKGNQYRGAIVAIDGFSRYAYTVPIKGNLNSKKATDAMIEIIKSANDQYPRYENKIRIIQTDKGSEFQGEFRDYMVKLNTDIRLMPEDELKAALRKKKLSEEGTIGELRGRLRKSVPKGKEYSREYFKHLYGYTARSHTQSLVERVNGTLKRLMLKLLENDLEQPWNNILEEVTKIYNSNYHTTIKDSPANVGKYLEDGDDASVEKVRQNILKRAKKKGTLAVQKYRAGDYVRIKIFKAKKLEPKFSFKGGLADTLAKNEDDDLREEFQGVFMIHSVRMGKSAEKGGRNDKPGRATTYRIVHNWSKESNLGSLPSGQVAARAGKQIKVRDATWFKRNTMYAKAAFGRNFTANELSLVPQDEYGLPIVEESSYIADKKQKEKKGEEFEIEKILSRRREFEGADNFVYLYKVKYKGFKEPEEVGYKDVAGTAALDEFFKRERPRPS